MESEHTWQVTSHCGVAACAELSAPWPFTVTLSRALCPLSCPPSSQGWAHFLQISLSLRYSQWPCKSQQHPETILSAVPLSCHTAHSYVSFLCRVKLSSRLKSLSKPAGMMLIKQTFWNNLMSTKYLKMLGSNLDHRRKDILSCVLEFVYWAVASRPVPLACSSSIWVSFVTYHCRRYLSWWCCGFQRCSLLTLELLLISARESDQTQNEAISLLQGSLKITNIASSNHQLPVAINGGKMLLP